jgi:hypothetical protein
VPLQLSFLDKLPVHGEAPVWAALDDEQRALVLATLARLIANVACAPATTAIADEEKNHD